MLISGSKSVKFAQKFHIFLKFLTLEETLYAINPLKVPRSLFPGSAFQKYQGVFVKWSKSFSCSVSESILILLAGSSSP